MNEKLLKLGKKCLRVIASDSKVNSFLGGLPYVSSEIEWPRKNNNPLGFIAQLDLSEINKDNIVSWLPNEGRLLFFYDLDEWPWGFDPKDKGGWTVVYENDGDELSIQNPPKDLNKENVAPNIKYIKATSFLSYPDSQRIDYEEHGLSDDNDEEYFDFIEELYGDEPHHQVGGFPTPIQNDAMEEECQLASNGLYCGNVDDYNSDKAKELRNQKNDWKLLFQFDSDDDIDAMWGDLGMLYFWIKESDAKKAIFSDAWMVLQCS